MSFFEIKHKNYTTILEEPELYVDNEARGRSGHMTHGLAEFAPNCFIDFNSSCSGKRWMGHSPYGWVEYRISRDGGKSYSDVKTLPYSVESFVDGVYMISVEKAVATNGCIVAFCLRNDATDPTCCEPWSTPVYIRSFDEGETWTDPIEYSPFPGRSYDALCHDGIIYVLHNCNEHFLGEKPEHVYRIYRSCDGGESFHELCVVPFPDTKRRGYGSILFDEQGRLHAYAYNESCENKMDHVVSCDCGVTWEVLEPCHVEKGIRNPQTAFIDGVYILHGRAAPNKGFVIYTSEDAHNWDEGTMIIEKELAAAYYSNNIVLSDEQGKFLLVQFSDTYSDDHRVNVKHMKVRIKK